MLNPRLTDHGSYICSKIYLTIQRTGYSFTFTYFYMFTYIKLYRYIFKGNKTFLSGFCAINICLTIVLCLYLWLMSYKKVQY